MCKSSIFKQILSLFIQLYIARVGSGSGYRSEENFKDPAAGSATLDKYLPHGSIFAFGFAHLDLTKCIKKEIMKNQPFGSMIFFGLSDQMLPIFYDFLKT